MMRARKLAVTIGAAAAFALGVTVPAAVAAQAGDSATSTKVQPPTEAPGPEAVAKAKAASKGESVGTANACWSDGKWWCNNVAGAPIYASGSTTVVGHVETNPSVFVCRSDNGGNHGGPHPTRWEWTQADDTGAWGWMNDNDISSETDPLPVC